MTWNIVRDSAGQPNVHDEEGNLIAASLSEEAAESIVRDHNAMLDAPDVGMIARVVQFLDSRQMWPNSAQKLRKFGLTLSMLSPCEPKREPPSAGADDATDESRIQALKKLYTNWNPEAERLIREALKMLRVFRTPAGTIHCPHCGMGNKPTNALCWSCNAVLYSPHEKPKAQEPTPEVKPEDGWKRSAGPFRDR